MVMSHVLIPFDVDKDMYTTLLLAVSPFTITTDALIRVVHMYIY